MKRFLIILALAFLPLMGCSNTKETVRDATVWDLDYLDLTGLYTADATVTTNDDAPVNVPVFFGIFHTGPSTEWYGVTSLAELERIVFNLFTTACFDTECSYQVDTIFEGEATATEGTINTTFVYHVNGKDETVTRDWVFTNITPRSSNITGALTSNLKNIPILETLPEDFKESIKQANLNRSR